MIKIPGLAGGLRLFIIRRLNIEFSVDDLRVRRIRHLFSSRFCLARHGHEQSGSKWLPFQFPVLFNHPKQRLLIAFAHRNDHLTSFDQLVDQRLRNRFGAACDNDFVEGCSIGPAKESIADSNRDIFVVQIFERLLRLGSQFVHDLDRVNVLHQRTQDSSLISAASTNLQDLIGRLRVQRFCHRCNDKWAADCL